VRSEPAADVPRSPAWKDAVDVLILAAVLMAVAAALLL
jgi:hypothetical protein